MFSKTYIPQAYKKIYPAVYTFESMFCPQLLNGIEKAEVQKKTDIFP